MNKLLMLIIAAGSTLPALAQTPPVKTYTKDAELSRWVLDLNLLGGLAGQDFHTTSSLGYYPNVLNGNPGQLKYRNGYSFGADAQVGFFFGKKRHFGIGTGLMFMQQRGDAYLNDYHVEYQATDGAGNTFRQVVSGNVKEEFVSNIINIPLVLKYKNRFSKHWGFTADAGVLFNMQNKTRYSTKASLDYEAIYKFIPNDAGGVTSVYDNSPVPDANDWMITKAEFYRNNPNGNLQDYFNAKRALGYSVGTGINPGAKQGKSQYVGGSVGLLLQPSMNYFFSDKVALNLGVYYMFQPFMNNAETGYRLTKGVSDYDPVMNSVTTAKNQAFGVNVGVRFFLGKKRTPLAITSIVPLSPSQCGLCDGSIAINGLAPAQPVTIDYLLNNTEKVSYSTTVQPDGQAKIINLCAGDYSAIVATIDRQHATTQPVTLVDPKINITGVNSTNPTAVGSCDGTITISGINAGQKVTIDYSMNGGAPVVYTAIVNSDNTITIPALCDGTYNNFTATTFKNCKATWTGNSAILRAPLPPVPPAVVVKEEEDISTPILFDFDKSTIHVSSYSILDDASKLLKEDKTLHIRVDAYTDATGTDAYNQKLSERRANSVKAYLKKKGTNPARIKVYGHGESEPAADNNSEEGRAKNRRAVMHRVD